MQWILILAGIYIIAWFVEDKSPEAQTDAKAWADRLGKRLLFAALLLVAFAFVLEWQLT